MRISRKGPRKNCKFSRKTFDYINLIKEKKAVKDYLRCPAYNRSFTHTNLGAIPSFPEAGSHIVEASCEFWILGPVPTLVLGLQV